MDQLVQRKNLTKTMNIKKHIEALVGVIIGPLLASSYTKICSSFSQVDSAHEHVMTGRGVAGVVFIVAIGSLDISDLGLELAH